LDIPVTAARVVGFCWLLLAGIMQGAFPLPMKFAGKWKWEHLWGWYSLLAFLVLPFVSAVLTVPHLNRAYSGASVSAVSWIIVFGVLWGAGSVLYGLGIDALGMALGFSIMTALTTALGALVPLAVLTPDLLWRRSGLVIMIGNIVAIAGVAICAYAGDARDRLLGRAASVAAIGPRRSFPAALTICIIAGVLSAMFNFGYAFGEPIARSAMALGTNHDDALNAVWLIMLPAGGLINLGYCAYLLRKNQSARLLWKGSMGSWGGGVAMALLWTGSVVVYGWGANALGRVGPTLGWSLWNAILIATTVACGFATGEWRGVRGQPLRWLAAGIAVLIAGMFVLGFGVE
jgi:L-rhamnose-H+ transport protein